MFNWFKKKEKIPETPREKLLKTSRELKPDHGVPVYGCKDYRVLKPITTDGSDIIIWPVGQFIDDYIYGIYQESVPYEWYMTKEGAQASVDNYKNEIKTAVNEAWNLYDTRFETYQAFCEENNIEADTKRERYV